MNRLKNKKIKKKPISSKYQIRINKIENDFARMNGKFEEIFFRLDQLQEKLDTITSDIDLSKRKKRIIYEFFLSCVKSRVIRDVTISSGSFLLNNI